MNLHTRIATTAALLALSATSLSAQTSTLYVNTGSRMFALQGGAVTNSWALGGCEFGIAVSGDVRTLGCQTNQIGKKYTLAGVFTGTTYTHSYGRDTDDGTTDGTHNYTASYGDGNVYQTDRDWQNPIVLFTTASGTIPITYDPTNNSLWMGLLNGGGTISDYSMSGQLLGSFASGLSAQGGLAFDNADQTFWLFDRNSGFGATPTAYQYSHTGTLLGTHVYGELANSNILGAEFDETSSAPEPASFVLLATGLAGVVALRRRKKV